MRWIAAVCGFSLVLSGGVEASAEGSECRQELRRAGVEFSPLEHRHIEDAVRIRGPLGGVTYRGYRDGPMVVDCELALALTRAGRYLGAHGIVAARYSSVFSRRRIRTSGRWSRHAFGKAIDVHELELADGSMLAVADHYEQGLGHDGDCSGQPLTREGAILRTLSCQLTSSGLFDNVLDPDYDAHHYNHYHLDVSR